MTEAHAPLAPSSAHRWVNCPASPRMEALYPQTEETPEAQEGTAAHWFAFESVYGREPEEGTHAPNGYAITREIIAETAEYVSTLREEMDGLHLEKTLVACALLGPDVWGTPDAFRFDADRKTLIIRDFKFGHRYVDEFDNWQLLAYAALILSLQMYSDWSLETVIHQPRYYGPQGQVRTARFTAMQLYPKFLLLREAVLATQAPDALCITGEHCRDCLAAHACPALQAVGYLAIDLSKSAQPINLSPEALGKELTLITQAEQRLKARRTGLEAQALAAIQSGTLVTGWVLGRSGARTGWARPASEIIGMGELMGLNLAKPLEAITPAQAKKAGFPPDLYDAFTSTPLGSVKLEPFTERTIAKRLSK